jgi:OOP family OmpA-OmpF porin
MVPDDFGQTEAVIAQAEQSPGAQYCPEKIAQAKDLAKQGAEVYWSCHNTESSRLLAEARKLAEEAEKCGPQGAAAPAAAENQMVRVCMPLNIKFDIDRADILPDYDLDIVKVANFMKEHPEATAAINGYADNVGTAEHNLELSQLRAQSVVNYLVDKLGIDSSRLTAKGYGITDQFGDNSTEAGKQQNRRMEAVINCILVPEKDYVPAPAKFCTTLLIDFATGSDVIDPKYDAQMERVANFMKAYPDTTAQIYGHTDDVGSPESNMKLSRERAEIVMNALITKFGIDKSRLSAKGFGDTRRMDYNNTAEGRKNNRRVEIWVDCVLVKK